jgi:uncharacterized membrane protein YphA (DoxX/SURF4 family)
VKNGRMNDLWLWPCRLIFFYSDNRKINHMNIRQIGIWILRVVPAFIFLKTLYFNFTANPQSVRLFTQLRLEPYGRIGTAVLDTVAVILLLIPKFTGYGAILGMIMMTGALYFHLTKIGIFFDGDPVLFICAAITFVCCALLIFVYKIQVDSQLNRK